MNFGLQLATVKGLGRSVTKFIALNMDQETLKELENIYNECAKSPDKYSKCSHPNSVHIDPTGIWIMHCKSCGLYSMASKETALYLGWDEISKLV